MRINISKLPARESERSAELTPWPVREAGAKKFRADITSAPYPARPGKARLGAAVEALDGRVLTRCVVKLLEAPGRWTARLTQLDRPGVIASMFFAERARNIVLRLDDGRHAQARIASTSFIASSERVCDVAGVEPLA
jgi:hypothetical protein